MIGQTISDQNVLSQREKVSLFTSLFLTFCTELVIYFGVFVFLWSHLITLETFDVGHIFSGYYFGLGQQFLESRKPLKSVTSNIDIL